MRSKEMVIGQPIKRGEDIFIRDEDGNIIGQKNTHILIRDEDPVEVEKRKILHEEQRKVAYKTNRAMEYPDFGEFADMMYHDIQYIIDTGNIEQLTPAQRAWYEKCKAVKEKHPKPSV